MGWKDDVVDVGLSALSELPAAGALIRLLDKWENDARLGKVEENVEHLLQTIGRDGHVLDAHIQEAIRIALTIGGPEAFELRKADSCLTILRALNTRSELGREWDPELHRDEVITILRSLAGVADPVAELRAVIFELKRTDLILVCDNANTPPGTPPVESIGPHRNLFCRTDSIFQAWNPADDAKELCRRSKADGGFNASILDDVLQWKPRRFNSAATYALRRGWIKVPYRNASHSLYTLPWAHLTEEGEFFLES